MQHWSHHFVNVTKDQILSRPGSGLIYQSFITNYDGFSYYKLRDEVLLQIITNYENVLTNWQVQLYYSRRQDYNELRRLLQIMSEQTCYIFSIIFWKPDISHIYGSKEGHCYWMFTLYLNQTPIHFWIFCLVCDCLPFWVIFELWFILEQDAK